MPPESVARTAAYRPNYASLGVSDERLEELKEIAGDGTVADRCRRLLPIVHAHFDHYLGPLENPSAAETRMRAA